MRQSAGRAVRGHLVELLQQALAAKGVSPGPVDRVFGPGVARAVAAWQAEAGRRATGEVEAADWRALTGLPAPSVFDRGVQMLAAYEGTGFGGAVGNFDGAYCTFGLIGFTLKHELPKLLTDIEREMPGEARAALGRRRWMRLLAASRGNAAEKREFGDWLSRGARKVEIRRPWAEGFRRLGALEGVRRLQLERAFHSYYAKLALRDATRFGATTAREVGLFFDTAIQNGGVNTKKRRLIEAALSAAPGLIGDARMARIAEAIADGSSRRWRNDVLRRRRVFATGAGSVHGARYIAADWGLGDEPVDLADLARDRITVSLRPIAAPMPPQDPPLTFGATGPMVQLAQELLAAQGRRLLQDGSFGPATRLAVRAFQRGSGLKPDGLIGPLTWAALRAVMRDRAA